MNAASNDEGVNAKGNGNNVTSKVYLRQMLKALLKDVLDKHDREK